MVLWGQFSSFCCIVVWLAIVFVFSFSAFLHMLVLMLICCSVDGFSGVLVAQLGSLPPSVIAFFACSSTFLFPSTPLCPNIHLTFIPMLLCFFYNALMFLWILSNM
jgi:hypothetical protein